MMAIGLIITFLGLGDKGFKTLELKLIGPSLVGCGVFFALLRILFCTVPSCCRCCNKKKDSLKLSSEEKLMEQKIRSNVKTAVTRNGLLKPMRDTVTNEKRRLGAGHAVSRQTHFVTDSEEDKPSQDRAGTRLKLKPARQANMKELNWDRKTDFDGNFSDSSNSTFSMGDLGPELRPQLPRLGGSTTNVREGEIIMNVDKLKATDSDLPVQIYLI